MTAVYKGSATAVNRGVAIVEQQYVMVKDEITTADKPTTVKWVMLTPADVSINANGTATLTQKGKKLQLKVLEPENVTVKTWSTTPTHDYDALNPGTAFVGFEVSIPANAHQSLTVLLIPEGANVDNNKKVPLLKEWKNQK